jgi:hypothetical protein
MYLLVYVPRLNWNPGLQGLSSRHYPGCNDPKGTIAPCRNLSNKLSTTRTCGSETVRKEHEQRRANARLKAKLP